MKKKLTILGMLKVIEKSKSIYNIHYCNAGVGFICYTGPWKDHAPVANWKDFLFCDRYYKTFSDAVKNEYKRLPCK